jgi:sigma-B regulation protein RsbU (phosphoserine phosphatase)
MAVQPDGLRVKFEKLLTDAGRLEQALSQMLDMLRKRGLQFNVDLGGMARDLRQGIADVQTASLEATSQSGAAKGPNKNLQLYEELVRTSTLINSSLDVDQVLEDVIDTIIKLTGAERAYLLLRDKETGRLSTKTARNGDRETLAEDETVFSRAVLNIAIEQRAPILTTNAQTDERFQDAASVFSHNLRSIICIPLTLHDQIIGILYADNRIGEGVFSQENVPVLNAFANQAAIAIENARLFGRVKADLVQAQNEVQQLRVQIDEAKLQKQLSEVMESDFFTHVQQLGQAARRRNSEIK